MGVASAHFELERTRPLINLGVIFCSQSSCPLSIPSAESALPPPLKGVNCTNPGVPSLTIAALPAISAMASSLQPMPRFISDARKLFPIPQPASSRGPWGMGRKSR